MNQVHQIHDKFFKRSLKEKSIAIDFLRAHLPPALYAQLDTSTLELTDKSLVLPKLREIHCDIVYRCKISNQDGYIVFLFEHFSTPVKHAAFRKLQYSTNLMDDYLREGHEKLPIVLPFCLYHGSESPYPYSTDVYEDFTDPELAREAVFKPFHLIDLTILTEQEIEQHGLAMLMEMLFKHYRAKDFMATVRKMEESGLFTRVRIQVGDTYLSDVLHYIMYSNYNQPKETVEEALQILGQIMPDKQEVIMNLAERLKEEGREEGRQGGEHQKAIAIAKKMLEKQADPAYIQEMTELSYEEIEALTLER